MKKDKRKKQTDPGHTRSNARSDENLAGNSSTSNMPSDQNLAANVPTSNPSIVNIAVTPPPAGAPPSNASANNSKIQITVALITGLCALLGTVIALIDHQTFTSFFLGPFAPSTPTPVPLARIESLEVIQEGDVIEKVAPNANIFLTTGVTIRFRVNVVTNIPISDMIVHWEFCHPEKNIHGQGAVEIPYQMGEEKEDCILVKIEKGGQFLDTDRFFLFKK